MIKKLKQNSGFALLMAIIITGMLLLISFVVADLAYKELILTSTGQQSQIAFYMADSGAECAMYWDLKNPNDPSKSAFANNNNSGSVTCNGQTVMTGSETTLPTSSFTCNSHTVTTGPNSVIGGGASMQTGCAISVFSINFANSCAIVTVTKDPGNGGTTKIDSRGYNTCNPSVLRRFERGITITY